MSEQETTAIATVDPKLKSLPAVNLELTGDPVTDMINRVASNPDASIETLERMIALRDNEQDKQAAREFNIAFAKAQKDMPSIPKRGKGYTNEYALWEDINQRIIKTLSENGMSISYTSEFSDAAVTVTATLRHASGHSIAGEFYSPIETPTNKNGKASMNKAQQRGSAMSYGKRYATINLLSLTVYGEDDDAFAACETDFDTTPWTQRMLDAQDMQAMQKITKDLKTESEVPEAALKLLRSAWAGRAKEIGAKNAA